MAPRLPITMALLLAGCWGETPGDTPSQNPRVGPVTVAVPSPATVTSAPDPGAPIEARVLTGPSDLSLPPVAPPLPEPTGATDEVEPNDTDAEATPLPVGHAARGAIGERETDRFSFDNPTAQRVEIRVTGPAVRAVVVHGASGEVTSARQATDGTWVIHDLFLLPGPYRLEVKGAGESRPWEARVVGMGPPADTDEREPNGDAKLAHRIEIGRTRHGRLSTEGDRDHYRFSLVGPSYVRVSWRPPDATSTVLSLVDTEVNAHTLRSGDLPASDVPYTWDLWLGAGTYDLGVRGPGKGSDAPYALRLDRLDPFSLPDDLEPNDTPLQAASLPADGRVRGDVGILDRQDVFRLPSLPAATPVRLRLVGATDPGDADRRLRLYDVTGTTRLALTKEDDGTLTGTLPAGAPVTLVVREKGPYDVEVVASGLNASRPAPSPLGIGVSRDPIEVAAYWHEGQRLTVPVTLANPTAEPVTTRITVAPGLPGWRVVPGGAVTVPPRGSVDTTVTVEVPPDAWDDQPVHLTFGAGAGPGATATVEARPVCGAPPVAPHRAPPLPASMLGGLDVAASPHGGTVVGAPRRSEFLIDGFTANTGGWSSATPVTLTFDLAGAEPVPVTGLVLSGKTRDGMVRRSAPFRFSLSTDGQRFEPALEGVLERGVHEQVWALPAPVSAAYARLEFPDTGNADDVYLGEVRVVASPEVRAPSANLADPALGGHIVWTRPRISEHRDLLTEDPDRPVVRADPLVPTEWVVGFHHARAARVAAFEWVTPKSDGHLVYSRVSVSASNDGPAGPWTPVGTFAIDPTHGATTRHDLPDGVWARYLRFANDEAVEPAKWALPQTLRVLEAPPDGTYASILGEWGAYASVSAYETLVAPPPSVAAGPDAPDTADAAAPLVPGAEHVDTVSIGVDEDWLRVDVPAGHNVLGLLASGSPRFSARLTLFDDAGAEVALERLASGMLSAAVEGGRTYRIRVDEPPRNIALSWDNSGSVSGYYAAIYEAVGQFASGIEPGRESANLLPFQNRGGEFLLSEWTDQPTVLQRAMATYPRKDGSSEAEWAMWKATRDLERREGTAAILLLTDADTTSGEKNSELWELLERVRPRVFTVELHINDVAPHQDLMQDWSRTDAGHYAWFASNADLDIAFRRMACHLRRPQAYALVATTRHEAPPEPGSVQVVGPDALAEGGLEIVLDVSGSMAAKLGARRRIDIARDVLTGLVTQTIPAGTTVALRAYGHREPRSCGTWLEVPPGPLDPAAMSKVIARMEPQDRSRTPLGASLAAVSGDLASVEGPKRVVVLTDGEETCDGDAAAAIEALKAAGLDVRVSIVGFAIDEEALEREFESWATLGGGSYFSASSEEELKAGMAEALRPTFQVLDPGGEVVATGTVGGERVEVAAGTWVVKVLTSPPRRFETVEVRPSATTLVDLATPSP